MKVIDTIKYPEYYKTILIGYTTVYIVDELPNIHEYIDIDYKKVMLSIMILVMTVITLYII